MSCPACQTEEQALEDAENYEAACWGLYVVKYGQAELALQAYDAAVTARMAAVEALYACEAANCGSGGS